MVDLWPSEYVLLLPSKHRRRAKLRGDLIRWLRSVDANVKWVEPQNLHWTLKFLGNV